MASFLDLSFFSNFGIIFTFLFVWVLIYGILEGAKPFGETKKNLHAMVSVSGAILSVLSPSIVRLINFMIPWFLVMAIIIFFILFGLRIFGSDYDFSGAIRQRRVYTWIIVFTLIILLFGLGQAFGQQNLDSGSGRSTNEPVVEQQAQAPATTADAFIEETGVGNRGQVGTNVATDDFQTNLTNTFFNPKILGLILIMLVAVFAMFFLSD